MARNIGILDLNKLHNISVIGLGKLGYPLAACLASKGHRVIGVDKNPSTVQIINNGEQTSKEPGLFEVVENSFGKLTATLEVDRAILESDSTFVVVPTPSQANGTFSNHLLLDACQEIGKGLADKNSFHLVIIISTVMPGSTGAEIQQRLEESSGKKCGKEFGLCYSPSFVALGSVIHDFSYPDAILIGESDQRSGDILESIYSTLCENEPAIARMNFINAEIAKLANNTFITTKITFGNMISHLCQEIPGADVDVVTEALGHDSRIGSKYLKGAIGYGGPCYPRDNIALTAFANQIGTKSDLSQTTDMLNREEVELLASLIGTHLEISTTVGILGLAYKTDTDVVEESQGLQLAERLASSGVSVVAYDPIAMSQARLSLSTSVTLCESSRECIERSDVVVITTPWKEFETLETKFFDPVGSKILIDCWRLLKNTACAKATKYIPLGIGPS